jgi:hypothetical protein
VLRAFRADLFSAFSRQNIIQNAAWLLLIAAANFVWPTFLGAVSGMSWRSLIPLGIAGFLLLSAAVLYRRRQPADDMNSLIRREATRVRNQRDKDVRAEAEAALKDRRSRAEQFDLNVEHTQRVLPLPLVPTQPDSGRFFYVHDVVVTNISPNAVSLMPSLAFELEDDSYLVLDQKGPLVVPPGFKAKDSLLRAPLDLDPGKSIRGDLGFALHPGPSGFLLGGDFDQKVKKVAELPVFYLAWRDLVSGGEVAHDVTHGSVPQPPGPPRTLSELLDQRRRIKEVMAPDPPTGKDLSEMTPYERLQQLHREGVLLAEGSALASTTDHLIQSINDVAGWSVRVAKEVQNVAPEFAPTWARAMKASRTGRGLTSRLEALEAIMSRLLREERRR